VQKGTATLVCVVLLHYDYVLAAVKRRYTIFDAPEHRYSLLLFRTVRPKWQSIRGDIIFRPAAVLARMGASAAHVPFPPSRSAGPSFAVTVISAYPLGLCMSEA
jgi:hypothetical protein